MIGNEPVLDEIIVSTGQDLVYPLEATEDRPFPDDAVVTLYAYKPQGSEVLGLWPAVSVEAGAAHLQIDAEDLDVLPDGAKFKVFVTAPGFGRTAWLRGRIWRRD